MTRRDASRHASKLQSALNELQAKILEHYPEARFRIGPSPEDPEIVHLTATVDVEDTDEVIDIVIERMMEFQIEDGLPIFVIAVRPPERVLERLRSSGPLRSRLAGAALIP